jgi:hypothetical protein
VQKPTQALKSVKGLGNTFDLNPKVGKKFVVWNFTWDIYRAPIPNFIFIEVDI